MQANQSFSEEIHQKLPIKKSFDCISAPLQLQMGKAELIFIDGFAKDEVMEKVIEHLMKLKGEKLNFPQELAELIPYLEVTPVEKSEEAVNAVLSGMLLLLVEGCEGGCLIDARSYPVRSMEEPQDDRVLRGSHDAFVETLIYNTALIRRRIRDCALVFELETVGQRSKTDVALCYLKDKADPQLLTKVREKIRNIEVEGLNLSQESLAECLLPRQWYNPLPRIRYSERPDTISSSIMEGSLVILIDNTPAAMILPTHFWDFLQEANDYYFPPLTGTWLKLVRFLVFILTLYFTPLWLAALNHPQAVPEYMRFILIDQPAALAPLFQLLIIEIMVDGLKLASMNTPDSLSSAFSILGAVILGEYAVSAGWFNGEVILYMAFVALSNYAQPSFELGYSFKFFRIALLILAQLAGGWGILIGSAAIFILMLKTETLSEGYLYPLIPFCWTKLSALLIRKPLKHKHKDFEKKAPQSHQG